MNTTNKIIDFTDLNKFLQSANDNEASSWLMNLYKTVLDKYNQNPEMGFDFIIALFELSELSPQEIITSSKRSIALIKALKFKNKGGRPSLIKKYVEKIIDIIEHIDSVPNMREYYFLDATNKIYNADLSFKHNVSKKTYRKAEKELASLGLLERVQKYINFASVESNKMHNAYESLKWEEKLKKEQEITQS
jgi:hypothetical protein